MRFIEQDVALENLLQHVRVSLLQDHARGPHEILQDVGLLLKMQIDYDLPVADLFLVQDRPLDA